MPFLGKRIAEIFIFEIILAVVFTIVLQLIGATDIRFTACMFICLAANLIYMYICLRGYYFTVSRHRYYLKVNLTAYLLLAVINIIMAFFNFEPFYTYIFFPYKLFMQIGLPKTVSALILHAIFVVEILFVQYISDMVVKRYE